MSEPLIDRIVHELDRFAGLVPPEGIETPQWTAGVKNALLAAGRAFGYKLVNASIPRDLLLEELRDEHAPPNYGEFIYDLSVQDVDGDGHWSNVIIAECEWGDASDIREDFEKLVVGRAALRVMVYGNSTAAPDIFRHWVDLFEGKRPGDTFLLAGHEQGSFLYRRVWVVEQGAAMWNNLPREAT